MIRWISSLAPTSTPWVGSASTSTSGRSTSWRASTTFCALPPDIALIGWRSCGVLHRQPLDHVLGDRPLPGPVHQHAEPRQQLEVAGGDVERDRLEREHALDLAVGRQQRDAEPLRLPAATAARSRLPSQPHLGRCVGAVDAVDAGRDLRDARSRPARTGRRSRPAAPRRRRRGTCPPGPARRGPARGVAVRDRRRCGRSSERMPPTISSAILPDVEVARSGRCRWSGRRASP